MTIAYASLPVCTSNKVYVYWVNADSHSTPFSLWSHLLLSHHLPSEKGTAQDNSQLFKNSGREGSSQKKKEETQKTALSSKSKNGSGLRNRRDRRDATGINSEELSLSLELRLGHNQKGNLTHRLIE